MPAHEHSEKRYHFSRSCAKRLGMRDASEKRRADDPVGVVIVAAGRGARAGLADGPKQYQKIGGGAVIAYTLDVFLAHPAIGAVVVAIHPDDGELFRRAAGTNADRV